MSNTLRRIQKRKEQADGLPKILIGVPSNRDLPKETVACLFHLAEQVGYQNIVFMQNAMINQCRDAIVKTAFQRDYDYIFWVDDDMIIPPDAITKLLAHDKDICSGLYFGRGNYKPLLYDVRYDQSDDTYEIQQITEYKDNDLIKVGGVGFGCCLTKVSALKRIWAGMDGVPAGTCFDFIGGVGEDLSFAFRCLAYGIETWVDTSIKCGHIGKFTVTEEAWKAVKDLQK